MKSFVALLALVGAVAAAPSGVTSEIAPTATSGCATTYDGSFEISVDSVSSKVKRSTALVCTLDDGVLKDAEGRTGYIASNYQFQFDDPPQSGALYTAGWSVCSNDSLALGDNAIFYECLSGTFYNLYDESTGSQCSEIYIEIVPVSNSSSSTTTATTVAANVITQIDDGQIQVSTATAVTTTTSSTSSVAVVSEITDGQIQATATASTGTAVSTGTVSATTNGTTVAAATATATAVSDSGASMLRAEVFGLFAGAFALIAML